MKLFLAHCGFYDNDVCDGIYESHVNFFVIAEDFENARLKAKSLPTFQNKRMHLDGLQALEAVQGFEISLAHNETLQGEDRITNFKHRELAPKNPSLPNVTVV